MTVRGLRGATTVERDGSSAVLDATEALAKEMAVANGVSPEEIVSVLIAQHAILNQHFQRKAVRTIVNRCMSSYVYT